jgi:tetratricopeptide (TPR) repeat protein
LHHALTIAVEIAIANADYSRWKSLALDLLDNAKTRNLGPALRFDALSTLTGWAMTVRDVDAARNYLDELRKVAQTELAAHGGSLTRVLTAEARLDLIQGNYAIAAEKYAAVLPQIRNSPMEVRLLSEHLYNFATASFQTGLLLQALAAAEEARELDARRYGPSHNETLVDANLVSTIRYAIATTPQ